MARPARARHWLEHRAFPAVQPCPARIARRATATPRWSAVMIDLLWVLLYAVLIMSWGWAWQRRHTNIGVVDVLWAKGVGASALLLALLGDGALMPRRQPVAADAPPGRPPRADPGRGPAAPALVRAVGGHGGLRFRGAGAGVRVAALPVPVRAGLQPGAHGFPDHALAGRGRHHGAHRRAHVRPLSGRHPRRHRPGAAGRGAGAAGPAGGVLAAADRGRPRCAAGAGGGAAAGGRQLHLGQGGRPGGRSADPVQRRLPL
ncbi:hypothetical protein G6F68_010239 [Rhizopus microsporus]|nr:hypothetical protein G6F68_010239 [Rhizopus microsporus]